MTYSDTESHQNRSNHLCYAPYSHLLLLFEAMLIGNRTILVCSRAVSVHIHTLRQPAFSSIAHPMLPAGALQVH